MKPRSLLASAVALALVLVAAAHAHADPIEIALKNQIPAGQKPSLTVTLLDDVRKVKVELTREDDRKTFTVGHGALKQGQSVTLPFGDTRGGHALWTGTLTCALQDGNSFTTHFTFETATVGDLKVAYRRDRLDLDAHVLEFQLSRAAAHAELHVFGDDGAELGRGEATYHGEPPGAWLKIGWTPSSPRPILRLELRATAADGPSALVKLIPWAVKIPHEEVVFATGQSAIAPPEEAKLDASYQKIVDAVADVRKAEPTLPVRLFIVGHTDTVGGGEDNRKLSLERARAIARWFHDRGLPLPIAYAGFGEDALKVKTADNTDEAQNRRADYIVGVDEPLIARGVRAEWHPLK